MQQMYPPGTGVYNYFLGSDSYGPPAAFFIKSLPNALIINGVPPYLIALFLQKAPSEGCKRDSPIQNLRFMESGFGIHLIDGKKRLGDGRNRAFGGWPAGEDADLRPGRAS